MLCHAAAHLFADGDLAGGMRNLWDVHCLIEELGIDGIEARAARHGLADAIARAARLANNLYGTAIPESWRRVNRADPLYLRCLLARDAWGRSAHGLTRLAFYLRSHAIRMPPQMLAKHLFIKWRKPRPS
jgi:hypothetical protein